MTAARWPGAGVHTVRSLAGKRRRLDRVRLSVEAVVSRMYEGACLHLHYDKRRGSVWRLSVTGAEISDEVARLVIQHPDVVGVGDSLFAECPSQTYRYCEH